MAKKCTKALFDEIAEDLFQLVSVHGYSFETAARAESNYLQNHGIYGFSEMAKKHGCKNVRDLYVYGGQLAGGAAAYDARKLVPAM